MTPKQLKLISIILTIIGIYYTINSFQFIFAFEASFVYTEPFSTAVISSIIAISWCFPFFIIAYWLFKKSRSGVVSFHITRIKKSIIILFIIIISTMIFLGHITYSPNYKYYENFSRDDYKRLFDAMEPRETFFRGEISSVKRISQGDIDVAIRIVNHPGYPDILFDNTAGFSKNKPGEYQQDHSIIENIIGGDVICFPEKKVSYCVDNEFQHLFIELYKFADDVYKITGIWDFVWDLILVDHLFDTLFHTKE